MSLLETIENNHRVTRGFPDDWVFHAGRFEKFVLTGLGSLGGINFVCRVFEKNDSEEYLFSPVVSTIDSDRGDVSIVTASSDSEPLMSIKGDTVIMVLDARITSTSRLRNLYKDEIKVDKLSTSLPQIDIVSNPDDPPPVIVETTTKTATSDTALAAAQGYGMLQVVVGGGQTIITVPNGQYASGTARIYYGGNNSSIRLLSFVEDSSLGQITLDFEATQTLVMDYETI